mgnify:CR=1 FL=1
MRYRRTDDTFFYWVGGTIAVYLVLSYHFATTERAVRFIVTNTLPILIALAWILVMHIIYWISGDDNNLR